MPLRDGTRDVTQLILDTLDEQAEVNSTETFPEIPQDEIKAALDRLKSRLMLEYDTIDKEQIELTEEGQMICDEGSHEWKVWNAIQKAGKIEMKDLTVSVYGSCRMPGRSISDEGLTHPCGRIKLANQQKSAKAML